MTGCGKNPGQKVALTVEGMSCGHCERAVREKIEKMDGVCEVRVDLTQKKVEVKYEPARVQVADLKAAITGAGYRVVE